MLLFSDYANHTKIFLSKVHVRMCDAYAHFIHKANLFSLFSRLKEILMLP